MPMPNPLVLYDNYFDGFRRHYDWASKLAVVEAAGYDGIELVGLDVTSETWHEVQELLARTGLRHCGYAAVPKVIVDEDAAGLDAALVELRDLVARLAASEVVTYLTLSLGGVGELSGPVIAERGSARAEERHWERGYRVVAALDEAGREHGLPVHLYTHIDWLCDTPQAASKLLVGAGARHVTASFNPLHWYLNSRSVGLPEMFDLPYMDRIGYSAVNNCVASPSGFETRPFDRGEIDLAQALGHLWARGYEGPISTQAYRMGGDPFSHAANAARYVRSVYDRFERFPGTNPATSAPSARG